MSRLRWLRNTRRIVGYIALDLLGISPRQQKNQQGYIQTEAVQGSSMQLERASLARGVLISRDMGRRAAQCIATQLDP
jgi:hypothetical protein